MSRQQVFAQSRRARVLLDQFVNRRQIHRFMNQHVSAFGKFRQLRRVSCVARDNSRAIPGVKTISIRLGDGRVAHATTCDVHVTISQDVAGLLEFVDKDRLARIGSPFVDETRVDIELFVFEKILRQLL